MEETHHWCQAPTVHSAEAVQGGEHGQHQAKEMCGPALFPTDTSRRSERPPWASRWARHTWGVDLSDQELRSHMRDSHHTLCWRSLTIMVSGASGART